MKKLFTLFAAILLAGASYADEVELTLTEGHTLLISTIEGAGGTDTDIVRFYIVNQKWDENAVEQGEDGPYNPTSREGWGIGGFANSDNWSPTEAWTGQAGGSWVYEYTVAQIKEVAGTTPGEWHDVGITINIYNDCKVDKVTLETSGGSVPQPEGLVNLSVNGEVIDGAASCIAYEWQTNEARYESEARVVDGAAVVYVRSEEQARAAGNPTLNEADFADWDSQFFITFGEDNALQDGDKIQLKMQVKADVDATIGTQCHTAPGAYVHWYCVGDVAFGTDWAPFQYSLITAATPDTDAWTNSGWMLAQTGTYTIAFNLAKGIENTFYFKDIQVLITRTATGITDVINVQPATEGVRYNLAGQRVDASYKGVVIMNGKKFINK